MIDNNVLEINVSSFTNGYSLSVFDKTDGYIVRELAETKAEVFTVLLRVVIDMARAEEQRLRGVL